MRSSLAEDIQEPDVDRVEARCLFDAARIAHDLALEELTASTDALAGALARTEAARAHVERAGALLIQAIRLMELRGAA